VIFSILLQAIIAFQSYII